MTEKMGKNWLIELSQPNSLLDQYASTRYTYQALIETREKLTKINDLSNDQMINTLTMGFWSGLFQWKQHKDLGGELISIFDSAPAKVSLKVGLLQEVHKRLNQVRRIRNKICHNEPIIFMTGQSVVDFTRVDLVVKKINDLTDWLNISTDVYTRHLDLYEKQKGAIEKLLHPIKQAPPQVLTPVE
jgi:hypothetical protein